MTDDQYIYIGWLVSFSFRVFYCLVVVFIKILN